jgi:hypothetical protein
VVEAVTTPRWVQCACACGCCLDDIWAVSPAVSLSRWPLALLGAAVTYVTCLTESATTTDSWGARRTPRIICTYGCNTRTPAVASSSSLRNQNQSVLSTDRGWWVIGSSARARSRSFNRAT